VAVLHAPVGILVRIRTAPCREHLLTCMGNAAANSSIQIDSVYLSQAYPLLRTI